MSGFWRSEAVATPLVDATPWVAAVLWVANIPLVAAGLVGCVKSMGFTMPMECGYLVCCSEPMAMFPEGEPLKSAEAWRCGSGLHRGRLHLGRPSPSRRPTLREGASVAVVARGLCQVGSARSAAPATRPPPPCLVPLLGGMGDPGAQAPARKAKGRKARGIVVGRPAKARGPTEARAHAVARKKSRRETAARPKKRREQRAAEDAAPTRKRRHTDVVDSQPQSVAGRRKPAAPRSWKRAAQKLQSGDVGEPRCPQGAKRASAKRARPPGSKQGTSQRRLGLSAEAWRLQGQTPKATALWDIRPLPSAVAAVLERATAKGASRPASSQKALAVAAAREAAQLKAAEALSAAFEETCGKVLGGRKWFAHYEQWLWARRGACSVGSSVPVFPAGPAACRDPELERKLQRAGTSAQDARALCDRLGRRCEELVAQVGGSAPSGGRREAGSVSLRRGGSSQVLVDCAGASVACSEAHWKKLRALYERHSARGMSGGFEAAAFCALARLHSLQGAHPRAGGMQAALNGEVFDALNETLGCMAECFASPLNCRWGRYCSASPDVDWCFGSMGTFWDFHPEEGSYEANPPFDQQVVADMTAHMESLLTRASGRGLPLCFVVVIPSWPEQPCWRSLRGSAFQHGVLELAQADHGYCEGAQHYRQNRHRVSNHDSTLFVLQTPQAQRLWPATAAVFRWISEAFQPRPG